MSQDAGLKCILSIVGVIAALVVVGLLGQYSEYFRSALAWAILCGCAISAMIKNPVEFSAPVIAAAVFLLTGLTVTGMHSLSSGSQIELQVDEVGTHTVGGRRSHHSATWFRGHSDLGKKFYSEEVPAALNGIQPGGKVTVIAKTLFFNEVNDYVVAPAAAPKR